MSRPATSRLKVNPPLGRMPVLQFCAPDELQIDSSYQRGLEEGRSVSLIRQIAMYWNWDLCQPLVVARRAEGELFVIDGQHRLAAAKMRGDLAQLPCVVVEYMNAADEAASFVHLNQQRKPLTKLDLFRAATASEDPRAVAITNALAEAGLSVAPHNNYTAWKPGMVSHIGGIERAWSREGPAIAKRALVALGQGFSGQVLRYCGTLYRAIVCVCRDEFRAHEGFDGERFERFLLMLSRQPQDEWMRDIKRYFTDGDALFLTEAAESLFRQEWRRAQDRNLSLVSQPAPVVEVAPAPKRDGFGLGAADGKDDEEWAWCDQCDKRRTRDQALGCESKFCTLRKAAA